MCTGAGNFECARSSIRPAKSFIVGVVVVALRVALMRGDAFDVSFYGGIECYRL